MKKVRKDGRQGREERRKRKLERGRDDVGMIFRVKV